MALQFTCPYCQATQTVAAPPKGRPVVCAKCKKTLQVAVAAPIKPTAATPPNAPAPKKQGTPPLAVPIAAPVATAPAIRPSAHLTNRSSSAGAYLLAGVVGITMLIGVTLAIVYWPGKERPTPPGLLLAKNEHAKDDVKKSAEPNKMTDGKKAEEEVKPVSKKPAPPEPEPEPEPEPPPTPLPADLDKALMEKAKKATVQLKVVQADGTTATAAGFFAVAPGVVVTNARVLGMRDNIRPPRSIQVLVNRGLEGEKSWKADLVALDAARDVAAVKVVGADAKALPEALPVASARHLATLQSIHAFGFSVDGKGIKSAGAKESSIAEARKEADGGVPEFQIKDKLDPDYVGGPVVDTRGEVIGVAFASKPGASIDMVVAGDAVQELLEGRVVGRALGEPYRDGGQTKVRLDFACADPLGRIKELKVVVWTGDLTAPKPDSWRAPRVRKGDGERKEVLVGYKDGKGTVDVPLPELPKEKMYWLQPVLINGTGKARWLSVEPWELVAPPLERRPALLALTNEPSERKTQLSSRGTVTVFDDKQQPHVFDMTWHAELGETIKGDADARTMNVRFERLGVDFLHNGLPQFAPATFLPAEQAAPKLEASWRLDASGALSKFAGNLDTIPAMDRKVVVEFYDRIVAGFDLLALQLPNHELKPLETWKLVRPWGKNTLDLTATYEGRRVHDRREEAYLVLRGTVKNAGTAKLGMIEGNALVDLAKGHIMKAELKLETDIIVPFVSPTEVKAPGILEVKLTREGEK